MTANLNDYRDLFLAGLSRLNERIRPKASIPEVSVSIETGLHSEMSYQFCRKVVRIGCDRACDVVLVDHGVVEKHVELRFDSSLLGPVCEARTSQGNVKLDGQTIRSVTKTILTNKPTLLAIGDVRVTLRPNKLSKLAQPTSKWSRIWYDYRAQIVLASVVMFFAIVSPARWLGFESGAGLEIASYTTHSEDRAVEDNASIAQISQALIEAKLDEFIEISKTEGELVLLGGTLPINRFQDWQELQEKFDGTFSDLLIVSEVMVAPELTNFPPIAAVRLTEPALITFSNGLEAGVGDLVVDGWVIASIQDDGLELTRDGDRLSVNF